MDRGSSAVHHLAWPERDDYYAQADHDEHLTNLPPTPHRVVRLAGTAPQAGDGTSPGAPAEPDFWRVLTDMLTEALLRPDCPLAAKSRLLSAKTELAFGRRQMDAP